MPKEIDCVPLYILKQFTQSHPGIWKELDYWHTQNGVSPLPHWESWCYLPMTLVQCTLAGNRTVDTMSFNEMMQMTADAQIAAALAPWRKSKEIFDIDPEMEKLLYEQADDLRIPSEILKHLPYDCFYIKTNSFRVYGDMVDIDGFFVYLEDDIENSQEELRFLFCYPNGKCYGHTLHLDQETISESLDAATAQGQRHFNSRLATKFMGADPALKKAKAYIDTEYDDVRNNMLDMTEKAVQLVLYILSVNGDVEQDPKPVKRTNYVKDQYREVRKWNVGRRIGAQYAKKKNVNRDSSNATAALTGGGNGLVSASGGKGVSKRPHMRRGHWHHYWHGPRGNQELILKWIAPTAINITDEDDTPVVDHEVKFDA